jgi:integrase
MENLNLGRYVCIRRGHGNRCRAYFVVPGRLRPQGWPSSIALPEVGDRAGSLANQAYLAKIKSEAKRLNKRLEERRLRTRLSESNDRSVERLADIYYRRDVYKSLSRSRQYRNAWSIDRIVEWAKARGNPDVTTLTALDIDDFLSIYDDRRGRRFDMRSVWNRLFDTACYAGWLEKSPLPRGNWKTPKPSATVIWRQEDVDRYATAATALMQPGLAALIQTAWLTGQRVGDLRTALWGAQFNGQRFLIRQSKTGVLVDIPVPNDLRRTLAAVKPDDSEHLFIDGLTGKPFTPGSLAYRFQMVRIAASQEGDPKLCLKGLRHSCVCRLFEDGSDVAGIAGVTGHLLARVHTILERYFPDRKRAAEQTMRRSFLANGGDPEDFGELDKPLPKDWLAKVAPKTFSYPTITGSNLNGVIAAVGVGAAMRREA